MSSELAVFPDPKTVKSSLEPEIGEHYIPLVTACLHWACETHIHMVDFSGLADALKNPYVTTISEIAKALKRKGKGSSASKFLLQLSHQQSGFLVLYGYLFGEIPDGSSYNRFGLVFLGQTKNIPDMLTNLGISPRDGILSAEPDL